jgi:hypothetical protein
LLDLTFLDDLAVAASWIRARGIDQTIGIGSCFGGRVLLGGWRSLPGLKGLVLASVPPSDHGMVAGVGKAAARKSRGSPRVSRRLRGLWRRARARRAASAAVATANPVSKYFADPFADLMEQEVPLLLCFGDEPMRADFEQASKEALAPALARGAARVEVQFELERLHGFVTLSAQDRFFDLIRGWFARVGLPVITDEAERAWSIDSGRKPGSGGE